MYKCNFLIYVGCVICSALANSNEKILNTCGNVRNLYEDNNCCDKADTKTVLSNTIATELIDARQDFVLSVTEFNIINSSYMTFSANATLMAVLLSPYEGTWELDTREFIFAFDLTSKNRGHPIVTITDSVLLSTYAVKLTSMTTDSYNCTSYYRRPYTVWNATTNTNTTLYERFACASAVTVTARYESPGCKLPRGVNAKCSSKTLPTGNVSQTAHMHMSFGFFNGLESWGSHVVRLISKTVATATSDVHDWYLKQKCNYADLAFNAAFQGMLNRATIAGVEYIGIAECTLEEVEAVALCEGVGLGPEDPLADMCAAAVVAGLSYACTEVISVATSFIDANLKQELLKAFNLVVGCNSETQTKDVNGVNTLIIRGSTPITQAPVLHPTQAASQLECTIAMAAFERATIDDTLQDYCREFAMAEPSFASDCQSAILPYTNSMSDAKVASQLLACKDNLLAGFKHTCKKLKIYANINYCGSITTENACQAVKYGDCTWMSLTGTDSYTCETTTPVWLIQNAFYDGVNKQLLTQDVHKCIQFVNILPNSQNSESTLTNTVHTTCITRYNTAKYYLTKYDLELLRNGFTGQYSNTAWMRTITEGGLSTVCKEHGSMDPSLCSVDVYTVLRHALNSYYVQPSINKALEGTIAYQEQMITQLPENKGHYVWQYALDCIQYWMQRKEICSINTEYLGNMNATQRGLNYCTQSKYTVGTLATTVKKPA